MIRRERRRINEIALNTSDLTSKIFSIFYFHLITILNVQLNRAAISEDVSDTIQLFMRRKL